MTWLKFKTLDKITSIGIDDVPPKLIILASHVISRLLSDLINSTLIGESIFPSVEKVACVTPAFKKTDRLKKENYRPISVLNAFSKVLERFLANQMIPYLNNIFSVYLSAYRKHDSCQHVLLRMMEKWRKCLHENKVVGAVLMDLSKAFDSLPHDLHTAKLHAYGFSNETLMLLVSYLTGRKQCVKNNNMFSFFNQIISGVRQRSMLGHILFNIFINDIFVMLSTDDVHNFADDNTITALSETMQDLINTLQNKTERAIKWMENNNMIANPDKFKAIILTKDREREF